MKKQAYPLVIIFLALAFFFSNQFSCQKQNYTGVFGNGSNSPLRNSDKTIKAEEIQDTFREIFNLYRESVVFITTEQLVRVPSNPYFSDPFLREFFGKRGRSMVQKRTGLGTGFIISKDGYICTNHHVISGVDKVIVNINDKSYEAVVIGSDERTDVALIKINAKTQLKPAFFGNSDKVMVGDWAVAIGNPFGLDRTFTVGVISAIGRSDVDMMGGSHIQTDASINPGNSGGPLINIYGEVIGINRMIYSKSGGYMGIGFAIPINIAHSILNQLKEFGKVKRGYFGITIIELSERYAQQLGLDSTEGTLVGEIIPGSPADKGGLRVGDVILKFGGMKINGYRDLLHKIGEAEIGKTVRVSVWRDRRLVNIDIKVTERP